jgi:hypothetical protein
MLSGCSTVANAPVNMQGMMALDGITVVTTGKTVSDHFVSYASGKNCSTVRRQIGQNFCEEDDLSEPEEIYCYNTLGNVNCFLQPQPFGQGNRTIDHVSGSRGLSR